MSIQAVAEKSRGLRGHGLARLQLAGEGRRLPRARRWSGSARELGYLPNSSARTLRTQRSRVLGVVLPTMLNPVFAECLQGIAQAAVAGGYAIIPVTTGYRLDEEQRAVTGCWPATSTA